MKGFYFYFLSVCKKQEDFIFDGLNKYKLKKEEKLIRYEREFVQKSHCIYI